MDERELLNSKPPPWEKRGTGSKKNEKKKRAGGIGSKIGYVTECGGGSFLGKKSEKKQPQTGNRLKEGQSSKKGNHRAGKVKSNIFIRDFDNKNGWTVKQRVGWEKKTKFKKKTLGNKRSERE